jgi:hypothetical protein
MTSERQLAANRRNSRKSSGPRSAAGERRASRNALRHGLAAIAYRPPAPTGAIERLARSICGPGDEPLLFGAAVAIAEAYFARRAIAEQRVAVIERLRDATAIALAKGDNSLMLGKARFFEAWLANREIEARVPELLGKYNLQRPPKKSEKPPPRKVKKPPPKKGEKPPPTKDEPGTLGDGESVRSWLDGSANGFPVESWIMEWDDIVPIRLKALLEEADSAELRQRALDLATKHIDAQQRDEYEALQEAIPDLKRLDRYERRAWSQQKCAIREFMNIKLLRMLDARTANP